MDRVNEDSAHKVIASFKNEDGQLYVPGTIHYLIDCETTKRSVLSRTEYSPVGSSVTISVPASLNEIFKDTNKKEQRAMKVIADFETDDQQTQVIRWYVINLSGI